MSDQPAPAPAPAPVATPATPSTVTHSPGVAGAMSRVEREAQGPEPEGMDLAALDAARVADKGQPGAAKPAQSAKPAQPADPSKQPSSDAPSDPPPEPEDKSGLDAWRPSTKTKAAQWDEMKSRHAAEIATLKQQLEAARGNPDERVKTLAQERDDLQKALREIAIERDPAFNQRFKTQRDVALNNAKLAAGPKADELSKLLDLPASSWRDERIDALVQDLPPTSRRRIDAALGRLEAIDLERQSEIELSKANWDARVQQSTQAQTQAQAERQAKVNSTFERVAKEWTDPEQGHFLLRDPEVAKTKLAQSREFLNELTAGKVPEDYLAKVALHVSLLGDYSRTIAEVTEERNALREQLESVNGSVPGRGRVTRPGQAPASDTAPKPGDPGYDDFFVESLQKAQAADQRGGY